MSEENNVAAELKEILDTAVAAKANKTDLEGFAKSEDLEGVVKSAELEEVKAANEVALEAAKTEIREELEAKFASAPGMVAKTAQEPQKMFKSHTKESGEIVNRFELDLSKSFAKSVNTGQTQGIVGSSDEQEGMYYTLEQFNPFRAVAQIMQVSSSQFKLPSISGISFASDAAGALPKGRSDTTSAIATKPVVIENWSSYSDFSRPTLEDLEGIRANISSLIVQAYSTAQAEDAAEVLKAGVLADSGLNNLGSTTSTVANHSAAGMIANMAGMVADSSVAYRNGAVFHVSPNVYSLISQGVAGTASGLEFDPTTGLTRFFGYPVAINGYLDDGGTAGDVSAYFGQFNRSLVLAERRSLSIDEYDQVAPGYNTYYSEGRFKHAIWDPAGLRGLETIA